MNEVEKKIELKLEVGEVLTKEKLDQVMSYLVKFVAGIRQEERQGAVYDKRQLKEMRFVDATPDGSYALRLLQIYRNDCDITYADNTAGSDSDNLFIKAMNKLQKDRAKDLDKAIKHLKSLEDKDKESDEV